MLLLIELSEHVFEKAFGKILEHKIGHITWHCPEFIALFLDYLLMSHRQKIILCFLFSVQTLLLPHPLFLILFFRAEITKFSKYVNKVVLVDSRVSLSNQLIDPIKAGVIEIIALAW